ncbi:MAG: hypothetical protein U0354_18800 [Candidatus Sericytochromatia bacterium]
MSQVQESTVEVTENNLTNKNLDTLVQEIKTYKERSAVSFYEIGSRLKFIKSEELYREKGFSSFIDFLRTPEIDLSTTIADRFIMLSEDEDLSKSLYLGSAKVTEILKLEPEHRKRILTNPVEINGNKKNIDDLSLSELRKVSQDFKREGKLKCDRCGRWVDHLKELDGKFYGAGSKDSCYDKELEERRTLEERAIPIAQFDNVLNDLKSTVKPIDESQKIEETPTINWLPESIYQIYGQFLHQYQKNSEELSLEQLEKEEEVINKLMNLLKSRLKDIKDTSNLLKQESTN